MIRLIVCDDSDEARLALRTMLAASGEIEVVGEAANGAEAVSLAAATSPDVVLLDVAMPIVDGIEAARTIRRLLPATRIVAFAGSTERETVAEMLAAGANAYCVKGAPLWELERAIAGASEPLVRLAHALARAAGWGGVGELVAREVSELSGGAIVAVYLGAPDVGLSLSGVSDPDERDRLSSAPGAVVRAFRTRAPVWATARELSELGAAGAPLVEAIAVPLVSDGDAYGAILAGMPPGLELVLDLELVSAVADLTAASAATMRRIVLTHDEARRDALTGLPNRRAFEERLAALEGGEAVLALIDLDDFKEINDRDGHEAGDEILRELARVVQRSMRADEQLYRLGGDEFALVLEANAEAAVSLLVRLRGALAGHRRARTPLPTFSAGVAATPPLADAGRLLEAADSALYEAKRAGKAQITVFGEDAAADELETRWADDGEHLSKPESLIRGSAH